MVKKIFFLVVVLVGLLLTLPLNSNHSTVEAATIKDVPKNARCPVCNMVVYQKNHKMGIFSTQAIKKNGKIAYYDDIGCMLFDEVKNKEKNKKYVMDYNTKKWLDAEKAVYVKTNLRSPMNWGYIYFAKRSDANKYIAKNKGSKIVSIATIRNQATKRYKNQFGLNPTVPTPVAVSSLKKDVPDHTECEFCNMVVYKRDSPLGVFSAQAIKKTAK